MLAQPSAAALNHLLTQNDWALTRFVRFAGKTARYRIVPFFFADTILLAGGTMRNDIVRLERRIKQLSAARDH